jgi:geranylgeranyl diphosphate synthase type II
MFNIDSIEDALARALSRATAGDCPPRLAKALQHAVFPGGGRVRPRLCLEVADACGTARPEIALGAAVAIELLHNASLVHDDLPCFDAADLRRGRPSVHRVFGEAIAILVGDGLTVQAFGELARGCASAIELLPALTELLADAGGPSRGIVAGQAWESEPSVDLVRHHWAKTAALFRAAACSGALSAGAEPTRWADVGNRIGEAYQIADDIADAASTVFEVGKPVRQDLPAGRPNAVGELGTAGALERLDRLVEASIDAIPAGCDRAPLERSLRELPGRLCPPRLRARLKEAHGRRTLRATRRGKTATGPPL